MVDSSSNSASDKQQIKVALNLIRNRMIAEVFENEDWTFKKIDKSISEVTKMLKKADKLYAKTCTDFVGAQYP